MKNLIKIAKKISILVLVVSLFGCTDDDDNKYPVLEAGFTYTINIDTGTVTFINISSQATNYSWDFGDETSSSLINPVKTYPPGEYKVILKATNVAGASDTFEDIIVISDVGAPIITLLGNTTINILVGGTFTDPGATATDDEDGDITANIVVGGDTVDVNTAGTYIITYNVSDAAGNAATQRTRTVIVSEEVIEPCVAETTESNSAVDLNITFLTDDLTVIEDGASFERISNPDFENDVNGSCFVGKVTKLGNNPWDNNQIDLDAKLDFNANAGLKIKVWSGRANTEVRIKLEEIGNPGNNVEKFLTTSVTSAWEDLSFPFTSTDSNKFNKIVIFFDLNANNTDTYYFDDLMLYGTGTGGGGGGGVFDDGLLTNGDFENGATAWSGNALNVLTEGGNSFNFANVTAAGNPYDVNLSQVVAITQGKNYRLSFEASSDRNRTILAGIGLNEGPWTAVTQTVNLTTSVQTFTFDLSSADFGSSNSRVLFDMGADVGVVVIDKVSLFCLDCSGGGSGGTDGNLATNGDFETGDTSGWATFVDAAGASFTASSTQPKTGTYSGNLVADFGAGTGGAVDAVVKQANLGSGGSVTPNTEYVISFDLRGSASVGGVFFVEFFSELSGGGVSKAEIITGGPHPLSSTWSNYNYTVLTGSDVSGGITLQLKSSCGPVGGCLVDVFFDNVSIKLK